MKLKENKQEGHLDWLASLSAVSNSRQQDQEAMMQEELRKLCKETQTVL